MDDSGLAYQPNITRYCGWLTAQKRLSWWEGLIKRYEWRPDASLELRCDLEFPYSRNGLLSHPISSHSHVRGNMGLFKR
jgi:hypothetical protein